MTIKTEKKPKSPYQRYGKTPYRYSTAYYAWRAAIGDHITKGKSRTEADRLGDIHWAQVRRGQFAEAT